MFQRFSNAESTEDVFGAFNEFSPDALLVSITNSTVERSIISFRFKKQMADLLVVLKVLSSGTRRTVLNQLNLKDVDYLIGAEIEFCAGCFKSISSRQEDLPTLSGIAYRQDNG